MASELETRRRNRVNGTVTDTVGNGLRLAVGQSFGNCPQYVTEREWCWVDEPVDESSVVRRSTLSSAQREWIERADTFFIGSGHRGEAGAASNGMDASHRGGAPGFVTVEETARIVFPDYAGNNHFNTIGNLVVDPRVALLFVDFETGSLLQISGRASIDWDSPHVADHPGAQRLVCVDIDEIAELERVMPLRFSRPRGLVRELRLVDRQRESADVLSLYFAARDDGPLPDFEAGQHLPLALNFERSETETQTVERTYSLSNGPGDVHYRISVKREPQGLASRLLHDSLEVGSIISSRQPAGDFTIGYHDRPVVLLSAGIGVTPMVSMLA